VRAAILTVSSSVAAGRAQDASGDALARLAERAGARVIARDTVADDAGSIEAALRALLETGADLVFTTGGTGLTSDDVTPEATRAVIDRDAPGFAEALRAESLRRTPMGMLSRGVAGIAGRTLIVNLPGSPRAVDELFGVLAPVLEHAVATLADHGREQHHHRAAPDASGA
jgi:molybdenum cofactor synthesis domain-containing protein